MLRDLPTIWLPKQKIYPRTVALNVKKIEYIPTGRTVCENRVHYKYALVRIQKADSRYMYIYLCLLEGGEEFTHRR